MISKRLFCSKFQGKRVNVGDDAKLVSQRKRKRVKVGDDGKLKLVGDDGKLKLVSDFLKEAADEGILFEIFVRLSNCRSAIHFGSACHHWHSLISHPQFIPRFISHHQEHQDRYPLPYTIIFRKADKMFKGLQYFQPICKLFSEESMFLHGLTTPASASTSNYLEDFLPSPMLIRASCNDLLLVSPDKRHVGADLYICNPITKQFYQLPKMRRPRQLTVVGHALVCMTDYSNGLPTNEFKVVEIHSPFYGYRANSKQPASLTARIFSSESRTWEIKCFHYPRPKIPYGNLSLDVVTCNGIAYWKECECYGERVIALDLFNSQCGVIHFPNDFWWFAQKETQVGEQIGVVCGELRLLQVVLTYTAMKVINVSLKVWKLSHNKDDDGSWVLVHEKKKLKWPCNEEQFVAPFVHPTNGDVVFMVWGKNIFQYNLMMEDSCEMIDELQESIKDSINGLLYSDRLMSFPMVHPIWPTPLPPSA